MKPMLGCVIYFLKSSVTSDFVTRIWSEKEQPRKKKKFLVQSNGYVLTGIISEEKLILSCTLIQ